MTQLVNLQVLMEWQLFNLKLSVTGQRVAKCASMHILPLPIRATDKGLWPSGPLPRRLSRLPHDGTKVEGFSKLKPPSGKKTTHHRFASLGRSGWIFEQFREFVHNERNINCSLYLIIIPNCQLRFPLLTKGAKILDH